MSTKKLVAQGMKIGIRKSTMTPAQVRQNMITMITRQAAMIRDPAKRADRIERGMIKIDAQYPA
jgi:hypothetical protein